MSEVYLTYELKYVMQEFAVNIYSCTVIYLAIEGCFFNVVSRPLDIKFPGC